MAVHRRGSRVPLDWDKLEDMWASLEKTTPGARSGAEAAAAKTARQLKASTSLGKAPKKALEDAYAPTASQMATARSTNRVKRARAQKRQAAYTETSAAGATRTPRQIGESTQDSLPRLGVGRTGTPLAMGDYDDVTPRPLSGLAPSGESRPGSQSGTFEATTPRPRKHHKRRGTAESSRASSTRGSRPEAKLEPEEERWDPATLIEKQMMLPYLDKFLYIGEKMDRIAADTKRKDEESQQALNAHHADQTALVGAATGGGGDGAGFEGSVGFGLGEAISDWDSLPSTSPRPETFSAQERSPRSARMGSSRGGRRHGSARQAAAANAGSDDGEMFFYRDDSVETPSLYRHSDVAQPLAHDTHAAIESLPARPLSQSLDATTQKSGPRDRRRGRELIGSASLEVPDSTKLEHKKRRSLALAAASTSGSARAQIADGASGGGERTGLIAVPAAGQVATSARLALRAGAKPDFQRLAGRYVRFWAAARLGDGSTSASTTVSASSKALGSTWGMTSTGADHHSGNEVKVRSLSWLLQVIEDIYDAAKEAEHPDAIPTGEKATKHVPARVKLERNALEKQFLHYDGQSVLMKKGAALRAEQDELRGRDGLGPGEAFPLDGSTRCALPPHTELPPLPLFVYSFFERRHGVRALVRQACLELLVTLEDALRHNEALAEAKKVNAARRAARAAATAEKGQTYNPQDDDDADEGGEGGVSGDSGPVMEVELFASFLRELYTDDHFVFFLHARHVTQALFGLRLSALKTRVLSSRAAGVLAASGAVGQLNSSRAGLVGSGGLLRRPGDLLMRPHPASPRDGTMQPCLSPAALESVAKALMTQAFQGDRKPGEAKRLSRYVVEVLLPKAKDGAGALLELLVSQPAPRDPPAGGAGSQQPWPPPPSAALALPVHNLLQVMVETLRGAPAELVAEGKDGKEDNGGKMHMLEQMQETLQDDAVIEGLQAQIVAANQELSKSSLSLLSDQRRFEAVSAHLAREASGDSSGNARSDSKLDAEAVLALATEQGQLRTRLMLGKADEARQKAACRELVAQKASIEARREAIWAKIMESPTLGGEGDPVALAAAARKKRSRVDLQADKLTRALTAKSAAALRCFGLWCGQLSTRHEAAQAAATSLAGGWRKDLDQFKVRAAMVLQASFRKRRDQRNAQASANAELDVLRAANAAEAAEAAMDDAKIRAGQAAEAERQLARARKVHRQREMAAHQAAERGADTRRGAADFEVERRYRRAQLRLLRLVTKCWASEVAIRKCSLGGVRRFLKALLVEWQIAARDAKHVRLLAMKAQAVYRGMVGRRAAVAYRLEQERAAAKSAVLMRRIVHRVAHACLLAWHGRAHRTAKGKRLARRIGHNGKVALVSRWRDYVRIHQAEKRWAALTLCALCRGRAGRRAAASLRNRHRAVIRIQLLCLSQVARRRVKRFRAQLGQSNSKVNTMLNISDNRTLKRCFDGLLRYKTTAKTVKAMGRKMNKRFLLGIVHDWKAKVDAELQRRAEAALERREAATFLQKTYRRNRAHKQWFVTLNLTNAVLLLQRCWRGYLGRREAWLLQWRHHLATRVQACYRGFMARRKLVGLRVVDLLRSAEDNLYDRLKWYFDTFGSASIGGEADEHGNTALHRSAFGAAKRTLKLCLSHHMDPNGYNGQGFTPLHLSLSSVKPARDDVATYLMDHGSYIESPDFEGNTPLLLAAKLGRAALLGHLLDREANLGARDFEGATPLQVAVVHDRLGAVQTLLDRGAAPDEAGAEGVTPLHEAVGRANAAMCSALLGAGAWADVQDDEGFTPLMYAASANEPAMIDCLLEWGASVDCRDAEGRTALHIAAERAALASLENLLVGDSDPQASDADGDTALHIAVRSAAKFSAEAAEAALAAKSRVAMFAEADAKARKLESTLMLQARDAVAAGDTRRKALANRGRRGRGSGLRATTPQQLPQALVEVLTSSEMVVQAREEFKGRDLAALNQLNERAEKAEALRHAAEALRDGSDVATHAAELARESADRSLACVQKLLSNGAQVTAQNEDGDQPTHVCARLGHVPTMELLIEYEAPFGRRNWAELTPLGVARMHGQTQVVDYLLDTLAPQALGIFEPDFNEPDRVMPPNWDESIVEKFAAWEEAWNEDAQATYFVNKHTGEIRHKPPEIAADDVIALRDGREERPFKAKVAGASASGDEVVGTREYRAFVAAEKADALRLREERIAAVKLQAGWRRRQARKYVGQKRKERNAARKLQRLYRQRLKARRDERDALEDWAATELQRVWRGGVARYMYHTFEYEGLWWRRHMRYFALLVQRLWSGYQFRKQVRKIKAQNALGKKMRFEDWQKLIDEAIAEERMGRGPPAPIRSYRMFNEYRLAGTTDVLFYAHRITFAGSWEQPVAWAEDDLRIRTELAEMQRLGYTLAERDSAIQFQRMWRARTVRVAFQDVMKGQRLMSSGEAGYLQNPDSMTAVTNYALFQHVWAQNYDHARLLYARALEMMQYRGPDNAVILFSYAIFLAVTQEEDWETINFYLERAHVANAVGKPGRNGRANKKYNLAKVGYYRLKTVTASKKERGPAWHNYALCLQLAFRDYPGATDAFVQGVLATPKEEKLLDNFNYFLDNCRPELVADGYDVFELVRDYGVRQGAVEAAEKERRYAEFDTPSGHAASRKIAIWVRGMALRARFEPRGLKALAAQPVVELPEVRTVDERSQLVDLGLAVWLWEKVEPDEEEGEEDKPYWYCNETGETTWEQPPDENDIVLAEGLGTEPPTGKSTASGKGAAAVKQEATAEAWAWGEDGASLPPDVEEWEVCQDPSGRTFYYNAITGTSQWEAPAAVAEAEEWAAIGGEGAWAADNSAWDGDNGGWEGDEGGWESEHGSWNGDNSGWGEAGEEGWGNDAVDDGSVLSYPSIALSHASSVWEEYQDDGGKVYFYNVHTGESSWQDPRTRTSGDPSLQFPSVVSSPTQRARPPSPRDDDDDDDNNNERPPSPRDGAWEEVQDEEGNPTYYNTATGESTYERPDGAMPLAIAKASAAGAGNEFENEAWAEGGEAYGGESVVSPLTAALGGEWEETDDGDGPYWYNNATGETSWVQPEL